MFLAGFLCFSSLLFLAGSPYLFFEGEGARRNVLTQLHLPAQGFDLRRKGGNLRPDLFLPGRVGKGYGILYAPIPVRKGDDTIDILVFEDDAARANRIVDKFNLTVVDTASIKEDIEKSREERGGEPQAPEKAAPEKSEDDRLLDELMEKPAQKEKSQPENPSAEKSVPFTPAEEKSHPSAPISENSSKSARGTSDEPQKPSVRQELRDIQAQRKKEAEAAKREEPAAPQKRAAQKTTRHQPPKPKKKPKSKER